jgi:hypothetical protein
VLFQKIWATCEIGEYLLSTVNPGVNNDAEAPVPILDETFQKIDPSINNTEIKYLTRDMEKLLNMTVAPQLVSYIVISSTVVSYCATKDYQFVSLANLINFLPLIIKFVKVQINLFTLVYVLGGGVPGSILVWV